VYEICGTIFVIKVSFKLAFSALAALLVWHQEEHLACKKVE